MEVYFNELCMIDVDNISVTDLQRLNHLYKLLQQKDISCCRLSSEDFSEIIQMMQGSLGKDSDNWSNFLYAFFRVPYEDGLTEQAQTSYLQPNRRFINHTFADGIIHMVLPWTEQGLGIVVQTTGRNKRETDEIARILKEQFGHI